MHYALYDKWQILKWQTMLSTLKIECGRYSFYSLCLQLRRTMQRAMQSTSSSYSFGSLAYVRQNAIDVYIRQWVFRLFFPSNYMQFESQVKLLTNVRGKLHFNVFTDFVNGAKMSEWKIWIEPKLMGMLFVIPSKLENMFEYKQMSLNMRGYK